MDRIAFEDLGKQYGKQWALQGVNARFPEGEVVMVIGPNGSGKTTLIKCLLGLVKPTTGSMHVNGMPVSNDPAYRVSIGYMPQLAEFPRELTVDQLLRMMNDIRDAKTSDTDDRLIKLLNVEALLAKRVGTLSGGMRQRVSAVLAFRYRPNILVLDEPTAGLDPVSAAIVLDAVVRAKHEGATVLITSHIMEEVQRLGDRVAYLQDGHLRFSLPPGAITDVTGEAALATALPKYLAQLPQLHVESL
ncbi:MAG: ABC transporter ATP-binding protein [Flavobacteriales bacterium]|nr:ABC transporter ATP-binding protein [Flavobacteriales bacterium]